MTAQYLRKVSLVVGTDYDALDLSSAQFRFVTRQQDIQNPNAIELRVYNLSDSTVKKIASWLEFGRVVLQAGYDGNFGTVFAGNIIQVRSGNESSVDSFVDITAGDGDEAYTKATVSTTLAANTKPLDHVKAAIASMSSQGVQEGFVDELPQTELPRGKVLFGMSRDVLRQVCESSGCDWSIGDGQVDVVRHLAFLPGDVVVLNSATGLIGYPVRQLDGIHLTCLLNPALRPARLIQIDNAGIQDYHLNYSYGGSVQNSFAPKLDDDGYYRCIVVTHAGDTRGNDWTTSVLGLALKEPPPNALVASGVISEGI